MQPGKSRMHHRQQFRLQDSLMHTFLWVVVVVLNLRGPSAEGAAASSSALQLNAHTELKMAAPSRDSRQGNRNSFCFPAAVAGGLLPLETPCC
ncbi:hypothetical protein EYF80_013408 [Liparis tanakae]|uniref:Uncharacterized protein n=1 Tax=Liparis tanakae TaxID=230148 RepID=A0A4Z2IE17_9TELE|nr:hypothetical protein EYF80_013408 [Liparis tanakae]